MKTTDALGVLLIAVAFVAAAVPWTLGDRSEAMVWGFAVAPPLVLVLLLGFRERRRALVQ